MPDFCGKLARRVEKASKPPADAPIATIGNKRSGGTPSPVEVVPREGDGGFLLLRLRSEDFSTEMFHQPESHCVSVDTKNVERAAAI